MQKPKIDRYGNATMQFYVRAKKELHQRLAREAVRNDRTLNNEIVHRLLQSLNRKLEPAE